MRRAGTLLSPELGKPGIVSPGKILSSTSTLPLDRPSVAAPGTRRVDRTDLPSPRPPGRLGELKPFDSEIPKDRSLDPWPSSRLSSVPGYHAPLLSNYGVVLKVMVKMCGSCTQRVHSEKNIREIPFWSHSETCACLSYHLCICLLFRQLIM